MTTILSPVSKLRGCVNQIENKNPSGASEQDILNQAKMLLTQYDAYKAGFKFDHVWPILKDESSPSPGMNSFDLNTSSEDATFNSSQRPMGVKIAKRNQQTDEQFRHLMEQNDKLIKAITKGTLKEMKFKDRRAEILRRTTSTNQNEEHGEGSQSQYHGSQYRASQNQRDQAQGEDVLEQQPQGEDQQDYTQYYNYLSGNGFPGY
ncbi:unnamed protein product [Arabidopsis thaliana]|uniref:No apical meristem-associated C-terminal domain-containing protein n=1 Tax=Arabidopsis thaliana TaxID=3702 RepID=A0A654EUC5_ARATH|nr:unnamed protein product [Arabidopsis thaliana]